MELSESAFSPFLLFIFLSLYFYLFLSLSRECCLLNFKFFTLFVPPSLTPSLLPLPLHSISLYPFLSPLPSLSLSLFTSSTHFSFFLPFSLSLFVFHSLSLFSSNDHLPSSSFHNAPSLPSYF
jgi:hypothetical protein